jgi:hypothetical protein
MCATVILVATMSTAVFAWIVCPTYGRGRWVAFMWAAYGSCMAVLCFMSLRLGLFSFGIIAPLLSQNVGQLLAVRALGPDAHRQQLAAVINRGGRMWFMVGSLVNVALRASLGAVLLLVARHGPAAWLGAGLLVSPLGGLAAAIRLALRPPTAANGHETAGAV